MTLDSNIVNPFACRYWSARLMRFTFQRVSNHRPRRMYPLCIRVIDSRLEGSKVKYQSTFMTNFSLQLPVSIPRGCTEATACRVKTHVGL